MSNNVVEFDKTKVSRALAAALGGADANDDLSAGVSGGFSVVSFRGSKWRIKHGGEETLLTDNEGETLASVRVVLLKANKHISKNFYKGGFVEGSTDAPDCWSVDGARPDAGVEHPVAPSCASCPNNQFGSRITDTGSKAKACSDSRRVAVIPEGDFANEQFGGPMLLRVPAASLSELAQFGKSMKAKGFPYNTIVTRISFDPDTAYPKLRFNAVRPLTDDEGNEIVTLLGSEEFSQKLDFILAEAVEAVVSESPAVAVDDPTEFEEPVAKPAAKTAPKPKPEPKAKVEPEPVAEPVDKNDDMNDALGDELESILAKLDGLD